MDNSKDKIYAKLIDQEEFKDVSLKNFSFYQSNYILRCVEGRYEGRQVLLKSLGETITIGSSEENNFQIFDNDISPQNTKLQQLKETIYYELSDLNSKLGTWLKISSLEDNYEITQTTQFKIFSNSFVIEFNQDKTQHVVRFTAGKKNGYSQILEEESICIIGGKQEASIQIEIPQDCISFRIIKLINKRIFINILHDDLMQVEGLYMKICETVLVRGGDYFSVGKNTFRILSHNWGWINEIGDRTFQEDKLCIVDDLRISDDLTIPYYAVYDGHGGSMCSAFIYRHFHKNLRDIIRFDNKLLESNNFVLDFCSIVQEAIIYTDFAFREETLSIYQGSTFICIFFIGNKVISCNLGDSISILSRKKKKIYLTKDFKPLRPKETERIKYLQGTVNDEGRMLGQINVSRSFGDWKFKDPEHYNLLKINNTNLKEYMMSNRAEFRIFEIDLKVDEYILLASDGLLQYKLSSPIFELIDKHLKADKEELKDIPSVIDNIRLDLVNSVPEKNEKSRDKFDNMTIVFIHLQNFVEKN